MTDDIEDLVRINDPGSTYREGGKEYWTPMVMIHRSTPPVEPGWYTIESVARWLARPEHGPRMVEVAEDEVDGLDQALADADVPVRKVERAVMTYVYTHERPLT